MRIGILVGPEDGAVVRKCEQIEVVDGRGAARIGEQALVVGDRHERSRAIALGGDVDGDRGGRAGSERDREVALLFDPGPPVQRVGEHGHAARRSGGVIRSQCFTAPTAWQPRCTRAQEEPHHDTHPSIHGFAPKRTSATFHDASNQVDAVPRISTWRSTRSTCCTQNATAALSWPCMAAS